MATIEENTNEGVAKLIESDARLKGVVSQWKREEALWNERFEAIRNALIEHQGEYITLELINDIFGDDIPYLRENNEAVMESYERGFMQGKTKGVEENINKAVKWLNDNKVRDDIVGYFLDTQREEMRDEFIEEFKKAMEE